jgi:hypothetical protein
MAAIDLNHVQLWQPPLNPLVRRKHCMPTYYESRSVRAISSRTQAALSYNEVDQKLKRYMKRKNSELVATLGQGDDFGPPYDFETSRDDVVGV